MHTKNLQATAFRRRALFALSVLVACAVSSADAFVILSGDSNLARLALDTDDALFDPGNAQFFTNALGTGVTAAVAGGIALDNTTAMTNLNEHYNSLPGVTSSILAGPISDASLVGVDLLVNSLPDAAYSAAEIDAMVDFATSGGDIIFLGEHSGVGYDNSFINTALTALNTGMSILSTSLDAGNNTASGLQIATHALTTGVTSLGYGGVSEISGGQTLFFATGGQPIVAVADTPEPTTAALLLALGVTGLATRRRRAA